MTDPERIDPWYEPELVPLLAEWRKLSAPARALAAKNIRTVCAESSKRLLESQHRHLQPITSLSDAYLLMEKFCAALQKEADNE